MSTIKKEYIFMPYDRASFQTVVGGYTPSGVSLSVWEVLILSTWTGTAVLASTLI
jgi:hypothetical protein